MQTGELIGSGLDADVYALDDSWVLRRTRDRRTQAREAAVMAHLYKHGYPVPEVRADGGPPEDLVMRRVTGPTLLEAALAGEVDADRVGAMLAELLVRLHAVPVQAQEAEAGARPEPDGGSGPGSAVGPGSAGNASGAAGPGSPSSSAGGPNNTTGAEPEIAILHLDLHPLNIILTADGPVVIDWTNTRQDHPSLDWAMSALILAQVALDGSELSAPADALLTALLAHRPPTVVLDAVAMGRAHAERAANPHDVHDHLDEAVSLVVARAG